MSNPFDDLKEGNTTSTEPEEAEPSDSKDPESVDTETATEGGSTTCSDSRLAADEPSTAPSSASRTSDESITEPPADRDESDGTAAGSVSPAETGPAFEYSEVKQKPFYARTETVTEFENAIRTTIVPTLAEAEVLDEETREIHDAVLRLANEQPERVAELVLEERRRSGSQ